MRQNQGSQEPENPEIATPRPARRDFPASTLQGSRTRTTGRIPRPGHERICRDCEIVQAVYVPLMQNNCSNKITNLMTPRCTGRHVQESLSFKRQARALWHFGSTWCRKPAVQVIASQPHPACSPIGTTPQRLGTGLARQPSPMMTSLEAASGPQNIAKHLNCRSGFNGNTALELPAFSPAFHPSPKADSALVASAHLRSWRRYDDRGGPLCGREGDTRLCRQLFP
jgi:hypothetical protein